MLKKLVNWFLVTCLIFTFILSGIVIFREDARADTLVMAYYSESETITNNGGATHTWTQIRIGDALSKTSNETEAALVCGSTANMYDYLIRGFVTFNLLNLPNNKEVKSAYIRIKTATITHNFTNQIMNYAFYKGTPANKLDIQTTDWDNWSNKLFSEKYSTTVLASNTWYDIDISEGGLRWIEKYAGTNVCFAYLNEYDVTVTTPTYEQNKTSYANNGSLTTNGCIMYISYSNNVPPQSYEDWENGVPITGGDLLDEIGWLIFGFCVVIFVMAVYKKSGWLYIVSMLSWIGLAFYVGDDLGVWLGAAITLLIAYTAYKTISLIRE